MKCPACSNRLGQVKFGSTVLDFCHSCNGIWFDAGELASVVKHLSLGEDITPQETRLFRRRHVKTTFKVKEKEKLCPRCNNKMRRFNYSYDSNIFLDKCPDCGGIWTDGGEVRQIASYLKDDPETTAAGRAIVEILARPQDETEKNLLSWFVFVPTISIPIGDDIERKKFPIVTISIIVICVLMFYKQFEAANPNHFVQTFGFVPVNFFSLGLITSMFLHANVLHLAGNMLFLWLFGDNIEDRFNRLVFVLIYLFCGMFASALHAVFNWDSQMPVVGASGAVSGIMGAYLIFYPTAKLKILIMCRILEVPALLYLSGWLVIQLIAAFSSSQDQVASNIAWYAHIGGFLCGAVVAFLKKISSEEMQAQHA
jgi:membrane associated rhomboid family serine protease/Zn-finger nucleic acid-binding protein